MRELQKKAIDTKLEKRFPEIKEKQTRVENVGFLGGDN